MNLTRTLLLLMVASLIGLIFANELPGTWWQWALAAGVLLIGAAGASNTEEEE